jgi:hypothetical protein
VGTHVPDECLLSAIMLLFYVYDGPTETSLQWQVTDFHLCLSSSVRRLIVAPNAMTRNCAYSWLYTVLAMYSVGCDDPALEAWVIYGYPMPHPRTTPLPDRASDGRYSITDDYAPQNVFRH